MFSWLMGKDKIDPVEQAMLMYKQCYVNDICNGYSVETAEESGVRAAESYMTQYLSFKERGL